MRKIGLLVALVGGLAVLDSVQASNIIRTFAPVAQAPIGSWVTTKTEYSNEIIDPSSYQCTNWTPETSTVSQGVTFTQYGSGCTAAVTATAQDTQVNTVTKATRTSNPYQTNYTKSGLSTTRSAVGTSTSSCQYSRSSPVSYVIRKKYSRDSKVYYGGDFIWNGVTVYSRSDASQASSIPTQVSVNGYIYTVGKTMAYTQSGMPALSYYEICRQAE